MKYLIRNKLISIGKQFSEEELERLYDTYTVHHSNEFVSKSQILVALKSINVIKRKGFADQNNNLVEFKEYVFLNYDEGMSFFSFSSRVNELLRGLYFFRSQ